MAAGDFVWFTQAKVDLGNKIHNLGSGGDTIKFALITSAATPTETTAAPHWGGTGTTNFNTNEVTGTGGNYPAEGYTLLSQVFEASGANAKFDFADVSIAQNASNPTNARWAIIYNSTDANKRCLGYVDLGSDRDLTTGAFTFAPNASGLVTLS
jgi:hypothetical protein